jgi:hypothetical protein
MIFTIEAPDRDCEDHAVGQHKVCAATVHVSCATLDVVATSTGPLLRYLCLHGRPMTCANVERLP